MFYFCGRVIGNDFFNEPLNNNYAWKDMTLNGITIIGSITDINGGDIDTSVIQSEFATGNLIPFDPSQWILSEGKLPILTGISGQSDALPSYITGLAGSGDSENDPYRIYSAADLAYIADIVNQDSTFSINKYFRLENDIDLSDYAGRWIPIGTQYNMFKGNFDGNHKTITGLKITEEQSGNGLFGYIYQGTIKNLTIQDAVINADASYMGGLAAYIVGGCVENCRFSGSIANLGFYENRTGGIVGYSQNTDIINCTNTATVEATNSITGGIIGHAYSGKSVIRCLNTGNISGNGQSTGGIVGYSQGIDVQNCANVGIIQGNNATGGIAGEFAYSYKTLENSLNLGSISINGGLAGGIVGKIGTDAIIQNCINTGNISAGSTATGIGGIAGSVENGGSLQQCASLGTSITGNSTLTSRIRGIGDGVLRRNYAWNGMKINGITVSGGLEYNRNGADANTATLLSTSFWRDTLGFHPSNWRITEGSLPYLVEFPRYFPSLGLAAYTFPASDSSDITLSADPGLLVKSSDEQITTITATGAFRNTTWPSLTWETSAGMIITDADTFTSSLLVPDGFTGTITVTAKLANFPSLPGQSITIPVNGDLEGTVDVSGTFRYGQTLTASSMIHSVDPGTISYQWMRGNNPIHGANDATYEITPEDIDEILSVCVTAQNYADKIQSMGQKVLRAVNQTTPDSPQLASKTLFSITLVEKAGYEYAILPANSSADLLGIAGAFQSSPEFTGLTAATSYDLYQRIAGTAIVEPSIISEKLTITTDIPVVTSISVKSTPRITYAAGESLNLTGLVITLYKEDGTTEDVIFADFNTYGITVSPANGSTLKTINNKVTITHMLSGKTAEQAIMVHQMSNSGTGSSGSGNYTDTSQIMPSGTMSNQPVAVTAPITATADEYGMAYASIPDQIIDEAITKAQTDALVQGKTANDITVELDVTMPKDATSLTITLTRNSINHLVSAGVTNLTIKGASVTINFDQESLSEILKQSNGDISITITPHKDLSDEAKKMIGNRPAYNITVSYGSGKSISSFGSGIVTVSISYILANDEAVGGLYGVYVNEDGNATRIASSAYDTNSNSLIFTTNHFSIYGVGYTAPSTKYKDIETHWGKESIEYVIGRGLLSGKSKKTFAPNSAITRGILVTALGKLADVDITAYTTNSFTDVKADSTYRPYIEWAYKNGIMHGITNNTFGPDQTITREEIAVIFVNFAKVTGYTLPVTREAMIFTDAFGIESIYKQAVKAMQQAGIMMGKSNNRFEPKAIVTRAEFAVMLHRYIKLTISPATSQGWELNDDGQRLYYKEGKACIGWVDLTDGKLRKTYYFNKYGIMVSGKWLEIDGKWYYFYDDGSLAKSTKVDDFEVDENGVRKAK